MLHRRMRFLLTIPLMLGGVGMFFRGDAADIEFVTQGLPWAIADKPYSPPPLEVRSSGACGRGGVGFSVVGGALPPGLELSKLGYFSGSATRTGDFSFGIRVSNGCTWTVRRFVLTVTGAPTITISPATLVFLGAGEKTVRISSTWPLLSYRATSSADWLKIAPVHGFTPQPTSALTGDDARISVDSGGLKPGQYQAAITISAWGALSPALLEVELDVSAKDVSGLDPREKPEPNGIPTSASRP